MNRFTARFRQDITSRRTFLSAAAATVAAGWGASLLGGDAAAADAPAVAPTSPNVLGPRPGYSPMIGTFISQLTWMREANGVLSATKGLKQADLDVLFDANANTIGALMLHRVASASLRQVKKVAELYEGYEFVRWGTGGA